MASWSEVQPGLAIGILRWRGSLKHPIYSQLMRSTEVSECRNKKQSRKESNDTIRGTTDWNNTPWSGTTATTCMSILQQEVLVRNAELASYHQLEHFGKGQMEWGAASACVLPTSQNPSYWNPSWLNDVRATKDPEWEWLTRISLKTHSIPVKPKTVSHAAEQFPGFPYPAALCPGTPSQHSLLLCQHMCLLRQLISECWKRALSRALEGVPLSCNHSLNKHSAVKQSPSSSSKNIHIPLQKLRPASPGGRLWPHANQKHADHKLVRTRRLLTSPPTNKNKVYKLQPAPQICCLKKPFPRGAR